MDDSKNEVTYRWLDDWEKRHRSSESAKGWSHPGMATMADGRIITCDSGEARILVFSPQGHLTDSWIGNFKDAHGITISIENGDEIIWIADNGSKRHIDHSYAYAPGAETMSGRVFKTAFGGKELLELPYPSHPAYQKIRYAPTSVAINDESWGGNGDVWVADGYGASLVHRYSRTGKYLATIDGSTGAGLFKCPHGIAINRKAENTELYVADRANARVQVFDLDGQYKRSFGSDFLTSPSAFAFLENSVVIAELKARLVIVNDEDEFVTQLFPNENVLDNPGWPNEKAADGRLSRPTDLLPNHFNSPHGLTVDNSGNIYVAEWLIGGRITKLERINA